MALTFLDVLPLLGIWRGNSKCCGAEKQKYTFVFLLLMAHVHLALIQLRPDSALQINLRQQMAAGSSRSDDTPEL